MGERTCAACADRDGGVRTADGFAMGGSEAAREHRRAGRTDFHAGHIGNGRVPACGKGGPPMRETAYRRRHCGPTAIFPKKCEPKGVDHD